VIPISTSSRLPSQQQQEPKAAIFLPTHILSVNENWELIPRANSAVFFLHSFCSLFIYDIIAVMIKSR